jgi:Fe-S-cluster containining protein
VQIVDAALAETAGKAGDWLVCRPGCTQCCIGAFRINALDAVRLRAGLEELKKTDPQRAKRIQARAREYLSRVAAQFPGDPNTGVLDRSEEGQEKFATFADDEICPALDPESGMCDLYHFRPMTCRVFGPPIRNEDGSLGVCELCFHGATDEQIAACEMKPDPDDLEAKILTQMTGEIAQEETIVAYVLVS